MKTILKFIGIICLTAFIMLLLAAFFPVLQTSSFGFATYILPWVVAFISVKKKKAVTSTSTNSTNSKKSISHNCTPNIKDPPKKPSTATQKAAFNERPVPHIPKSSDKTIPVPSVQADTKIKTYKVAGVSHYVDNIMRLACENTDYDMSKRELIDDGFIEEKIWKYNFYPSNLELQPEPDNPHDPNAIKVIVDGEHIGYIKSGSCSHVKRIIKDGSIIRADCKIGGGPYKYISEDYDLEKDKEIYALEKGATNFFVHLELTEQEQTYTSVTPSDSHVINSTSQTNTDPNCADDQASSAHKKAKYKTEYIINPKTMVIHRPTCRYVENAYSFNTHYTNNLRAALDIGYQRCKHCKPK